MGWFTRCTLFLFLLVAAFLVVPLILPPDQAPDSHLSDDPIKLPANTQWSKVTLKTSNIKLNLFTIGTPKQGKLVIFLHGFPESALVSWNKVLSELDQLNKDSYFIVAPDMRGYNTSDKPEGIASYAMQWLVQDVLDLIDHFGYEKAHLVAHDWGGMAAWATALAYPKRVEKLVTINIPHPTAFNDQIRGKSFNIDQVLRSWYIFYFQAPFFPEKVLQRATPRLVPLTGNPGAFSKEEIAALTQSWSEPNALTSMLNYYRAALIYPYKFEDVMVHVPTLILWGQRDHALNPSFPHHSQKYCDQATVKIFENNTHWLAHENSTEVAKHVNDFFTA